jgi:hypothetical protein
VARFFAERNFNWNRLQDIPNVSFLCGYCTTTVSSNRGYALAHGSDGSGQHIGYIRICPNCGGPIFFAPDGSRRPSPAFGSAVAHVPEHLSKLYDEARRSTSATSYTAAVLVCRKMLMNIAVEQGADEGLKFIEYVNYLADKGYVPPHGKHWVDHIRRKGNEATHEIALMTEGDAKELVTFVEMLLRFIYEFPKLVPAP